ncbi:MAG: patatin-like phospholipase family protein [Bacteroidota bacterium]
MTPNKKIALVFSGGGARGAYQVGAWEAMEELGLLPYIGGVYGTSVGAINGAAFVQGDIQLTKDIWAHLDQSNVFADIPDDDDISIRKKYYEWLKGAVLNGGMDVSPLKDRLREGLSETKIRQAEMDYGLVTFDLSARKPKYLLKSDIPKGKLVEYVIASATFPTFQPHKIGERRYIDGGIYDNRPLHFVEQQDDINICICVDVTAARYFWPSKTLKNHKVYYIRPSRLLGSPLSFVPRRIEQNMRLGYKDAKRQLAGLRVRLAKTTSFQ